MVFITSQFIYLLAVFILIISFFSNFIGGNSETTTPVTSTATPNLCLTPELSHWTDVCLPEMEAGGFFTKAKGEILLVFVTSLLLLLSLPFIYGLAVLWIT